MHREKKETKLEERLYVPPKKTSHYKVSPGRPKQAQLHLPCLKFKSKDCMKVELIISENKKLKGIFPKLTWSCSDTKTNQESCGTTGARPPEQSGLEHLHLGLEERLWEPGQVSLR